MSYKTSNKKKKSVTRLIVSMLTLLSILVTTLSIPIDAYANDIVQVNNDSDTDDQSTTSSSGRKNLVISTPTNANRNNAFWVCYIANTSGEMVTDPYVVFPDGFSNNQINKFLSADTSLLKCHLDTSVTVCNYIPQPVAGLPAPAAGREDGSNLNRAFTTGAVNYKSLINSLTNQNQALNRQILENADDYYIVCEVSGLTTHRSSSNRKITHSVNNPFISINITRTLPDGCRGFHLEYETIGITDTAASVNYYMRLWNSLYYNGELALPNNRDLREEYKNQLIRQIRYSHQGTFIDPRYPIKVVFDGDYKMYAATCLGWSMDESWWDSSQAWLWNYWYPMGNYLGTQWPGLPKPVDGKKALHKDSNRNPDVGKYDKGWGMAAIKIGEITHTGTPTSIDTYDYPDSPSTPYFCEYPSSPDKDGPCTIVKHYWKENPDGTYTKEGTYRRDQTSNSIHITDEKDKTGYELIGWWSSNVYNSSNDNPTPKSDVTTRRNSAVSNGFQGGTGEGTVTLNTSNNEKTLVLVFIKPSTSTTVDVSGDYKIWQSQISQRNSFDSVASLATLSNHVFKWHRSAHYTSCHANGGKGHLTCTRSEHTHGPGCHNATGALTCTRSEHTHDSSCYDTCENWKFKDKYVELGVHNGNASNYPSILSSANQVTLNQSLNFIYNDRKNLEYLYAGNKAVWGADDIAATSMAHYNFVIFRGSDHLTLAKWKAEAYNSAGVSFLTNISNSSTYNFKSSNTISGTRKNDNYTDSFTAKFIDNMTHFSNDRQTTVGPTSSASNGSKCADESLSYALTNPTGDYTATVAVDVFWADGESSDLPGDPDSVVPSNGVNRELKAGTVSFIPYIMMRYDDKTNTDKKMAVLSQRTGSSGLVKATFYDWVNYDIDKEDSRNIAIDITSTQWSTHQQAAKRMATFFGGTSPSATTIANGYAEESILPGGAVFSIGIPESNVRTVTVTSVQAYLPTGSSGEKQVSNTGGSSTLASDNTNILKAHRELVDDARAQFEKTQIREYMTVTKSQTVSDLTSADIFRDGNELNGNIDTAVLKNNNATMTNHTNSDTKYYFGGDYSQSLLNTCYATASGGSNLSDAAYEASTDRMYLTFFVNVYGEVRVKTSTSGPANISNDFTSREGYLVASAGSSNVSTDLRSNSQVAYETAVQTDVVKSLRNALASQRGNDTNCPWGTKWYNEAFDGVTYVYQQTDFKVGLWDPALRETVLDPAVTPYQENKDSFFDLFHAMALKTWKEDTKFGEFTNTAGNNYTLNYNFEDLYGSKIFYVPNVTTQDLN